MIIFGLGKNLLFKSVVQGISLQSALVRTQNWFLRNPIFCPPYFREQFPFQQKVLKKKMKAALRLIHSNSFSTKICLHVFKLDHRWRTTLIQKKRNGWICKKSCFSGTHMTSYARKYPILYPHQTIITFYTLT